MPANIEQSFMKALFHGVIAEDLVFPFPEMDADERESTSMILDSVRRFFAANVDSARIDREHRIPPEVLEGIKGLGLTGLQIPTEHGGAGLSAMAVVRSLLFYLVFYGGSVFYVLVAFIVALIAPEHIRPVPDAWSRFHRACLGIVGIRVRETGDKPAGAALYAIKHESFFEAIDLPNTLSASQPLDLRLEKHRPNSERRY